jgi:hypothetical protein
MYSTLRRWRFVCKVEGLEDMGCMNSIVDIVMRDLKKTS